MVNRYQLQTQLIIRNLMKKLIIALNCYEKKKKFFIKEFKKKKSPLQKNIFLIK